MQTKNWVAIIITLVVVIGLGYFIWSGAGKPLDQQELPTMGEKITYTCADDRAFEVAYGTGASDNIAMVILEGDMVYTLEKVTSTSSVKYANDNDDFVFELVDGTASITQLGEPTYQGCGEGSQLSPF